jgi:VWFA-related protein
LRAGNLDSLDNQGAHALERRFHFVRLKREENMRTQNRLTTILCAAILILCGFGQAALGQKEPSQSQQAGDVLKIDTELVQTGVIVTDKQGRFVDGLKKEEFELKVDGNPLPISFFENIMAGSQREQIARAAGRSDQALVKASAPPSFRRRTIIFFLDDLHLSLDSVGRTRKTLLDFIDKEMGQNDLVAIASPSGQIGFLQQFTDNKEVLRAAVARLSHVPYKTQEGGNGTDPPMTEYMALAIERQEDPAVLKFYVDVCTSFALKNPRSGAPIEQCKLEVKNRARLILLNASTVIASTYYSLDTLLNSAERMPGSKLAFFISDGFLLDTGPRNFSATTKLKQVIDQARRAGVVVYTIDARGLVSGAADATNSSPSDPNGTLEGTAIREISATQDALNALAADTGGRALRNQNLFGSWINKSLEENSRYYLLAWRPEGDEQKQEKYKKIEVSVVGKPDLTVRFARGFFNKRPAASTLDRPTKEEKIAATQEKKPDADLRQALADFFPKQALPLQLSLIYLDTPTSGTVLTSSVQASTEALSYGAQGNEPAQLSLAGVVLNDQGKPAASFRTGLKVNPAGADKTATQASTVIYNYRSPLKPGIYQVRVAARDDRSAIVGSNMQWIVIPDLSTKQLSLSSLIVGLESVTKSSAEAGQIQWSVDKKFAHGSHLRFMTFIYNASRAGGARPNLAARIEVYKEGQPIISTPFKKVEEDPGTDPSRVPFTADISLGGLQSGRYILKVTVEDSATQKTTSQQTTFDVQ